MSPCTLHCPNADSKQHRGSDAANLDAFLREPKARPPPPAFTDERFDMEFGTAGPPPVWTPPNLQDAPPRRAWGEQSPVTTTHKWEHRPVSPAVDLPLPHMPPPRPVLPQRVLMAANTAPAMGAMDLAGMDRVLASHSERFEAVGNSLVNTLLSLDGTMRALAVQLAQRRPSPPPKAPEPQPRAKMRETGTQTSDQEVPQATTDTVSVEGSSTDPVAPALSLEGIVNSPAALASLTDAVSVAGAKKLKRKLAAPLSSAMEKPRLLNTKAKAPRRTKRRV